MSYTFESRAKYGWPKSYVTKAPCKNGIVFHFDGSDNGLAGKKHSACVTYWKRCRGFHMGPDRKWRDIGYSFAICPHGVVMEGRGFGREQAAQPGGNTTWTSITLMSGPSEKPTAKQLKAIREFRNTLIDLHGVGAAIAGHRDFISTDCPGPIIYKMVKTRTILAGETSVSKSTEEMVKALPTLRKGAKGFHVKLLQHALMANGQKLPKFGADSDFGDEVEKALKAETGSTTCAAAQWQKLLQV